MKINKTIFKYCFIVLMYQFLAGCANKIDHKINNADAPDEGNIQISVDESYQSLIQSQLQVYKLFYPKSSIVAKYKPEVDCLKDFLNDSSRAMITSSKLSKQQLAQFKQKFGYEPQLELVAYDAVVFLIHQNNHDSFFSVKQIEDMLAGKINTQIVLDNPRASSNVKFLQDSILKQKAFGQNVQSVESSQSVIQYVNEHPNAIGVVSLAWYQYFLQQHTSNKTWQVKPAMIECINCKNDTLYAKPSQATISYMQYPFIRPIFITVNENYLGIGTGLLNFMSNEKGQLIFRRSGIAPGKMNLLKRASKIME